MRPSLGPRSNDEHHPESPSARIGQCRARAWALAEGLGAGPRRGRGDRGPRKRPKATSVDFAELEARRSLHPRGGQRTGAES